MAKSAFLLFLIIPLFCLSLAAQQNKNEERILFRGVVFSASSGERLPGSRFYINRTLSGMSRDDGTFSFFALKRDTILFDLMGYKESRYIVQDTLRTREFLMGIYLQSDTIEIGEVVIVPNLSSLKAEMMHPVKPVDLKMDNARSNLNIASYQGRVSEGKMSDPYSNYETLRHQQKLDAFEKGGIPSSRIAGINPFLLLPAAYLLLHGVPEKPAAPIQGITQKELDELNSKYYELVKKKH